MTTTADGSDAAGAWEDPATAQGSADRARFVRGGRRYVADLVRGEHLHLAVVRSEVASGLIEVVRTDAARRLPGVAAVLTAEDLGQVPRIPIRNPEPNLEPFLQPVLAVGRVRYVGEPIAVVVGDDRYTAEDAAELVEVRIAPDRAVVRPLAGMPSDAWPSAADGVMSTSRSAAGDVEAAFADAAVVVAGRYRVGRQTGLPIETRGLIAEWRGDEGEQMLHLWGVTKYVHATRRMVAELLGLPEDGVVVHAVDVGGMFGVRGEIYPEDLLVPLASRHVNRPVTWTEDRREHLLAINHSRGQDHDFELAMAADGELLAYRDRFTIDAGAYARPIGSRMLTLTLESLPGPYRWRAHEAEAIAALTNKTPVGTMRGPCAYEATFVRERAIDEAAHALGLDPVEVRRRNVLTAADMPYHVDMGPDQHAPRYDSGDYAWGFEALLEVLDVASLRADLTARRAAGEVVGLGVGLFVEHSGGGLWETVRARLDTDGVLTVGTGGADFGQGLVEMVVGVTAERLGIDPAAVRVAAGDSRGHHEGRGTFGSRSTIFVGSATAAAMEAVRSQAVHRAAALLRVRAEDVAATTEGLRAGDELVPWKEVAPIEAQGRHHMAEPTWGFGGHAAVVRIDRGRAIPIVERLLVVYDCGRAVDRGNVERQLVGGAVQGLGGALLEELTYDDDGQPQGRTLLDYLVPTSAMVPNVESLILEMGPAPDNPLGAKGAGEAGVLGVGAAVANAVADAVGARIGIRALPIPPAELAGLLTDRGRKDRT